MIRFVCAPLGQPARDMLRAEGFVVLPDSAHALLPPGGDLADRAQQCRQQGRRPWAIVGDLDAIDAAISARADLWLRGLEAKGACGSLAALPLIRAAAASGRPFVVEGLSVRAMAASLAVGAAGVVLDAELWLTRGAETSEQARALLRTASGLHDTAVSGEISGALSRRLTRGPSSIDAPQNVADARTYDGLETLSAARAIEAEIARHLEQIAALSLGEIDPSRVVQGPMANVAEVPGFAAAIRATGAIPFAALGALDPAQAEEILRRFSREVKPPWGVGVIGFDVMPHRGAHLAAIAALGEAGPSFLTLAGASVALAADLSRQGRVVWQHTPSGRLASGAIEAGVPGVIFEGHEAGGHVGKGTSAGLWEEGLQAVERAIEAGLRPPTVVLAGGIGDATSAAFALAMASRARALGARVLLQAGTAFLLTHEASEHGAATPIYQAMALAARRTTLVGTTIQLPLRCAPNPFTEEARAQEVAWEREGLPRAERRLRLEHHNLGRTRIAAKGIERDPTGAQRYRPVPSARQQREGAFTIGQGAALAPRVQSIAEVVASMTSGARARLLGARASREHIPSVSAVSIPLPPQRAPARAPARSPTSARAEGDIAIIGAGCVLPGAHDVPSFLRALFEGADATGPIPPERWREHRYYDPDAVRPGETRSYSRLAGAIRGFRFDPLPFRIPPRTAETMDPSQRLALVAAAEAIRAAGLDGAAQRGLIDKHRAAVIIGNAMGGEYAKSAALRVRFREVTDLVARDEALSAESAESLAALEDRVEGKLEAMLPPVEVDSMAGLLSNVVAGRVASWLDWMGGNFTVDAACAASLAALSVAVDWLRLGRCDVVLTGGVDTDLAPESYVGFCRTHALSRGGSAPFSERADGFVMGEGAAMFVLKRLSDAQRDGDPIWAIIRGVGASSDGRGRGITAPRPEGQALAISRAYEESGLTPADIGMVEAHGTGTSLGDQTELSVLAERFRGAAAPVWLGSVKSMIGHLKSAAGAASLLKVALSLSLGAIPPTLRAGPLDAALSKTPFSLPRRPTPLPKGRAYASVSAFGFGGTNYHVLLEAPPAPPPILARHEPEIAPLLAQAAEARWEEQDQTPLLVAYGAPSREALSRVLEADAPSEAADVARAPFRLVLLIPDPSDRTDAIARASRWLASSISPGAALGRLAFYGEGPAEPAMLAFPGQGAPREGAVSSVRRAPAAARAVHEIDALLRASIGASLSDLATGSDPISQHAVIYAAEVGLLALLEAARLPLAGAVGHSLGGLAACVAVGAASPTDLLAAVIARGRALQECPEGAMLAARLLEGEDPRALASAHGLWLAAVGGPDRVSLAGPRDAVESLVRALGPSRARALDVERAYHTPLVAAAAGPLSSALSRVAFAAPKIPLWSARTGLVAQDVRGDLVSSLTEPVLFDPTVRAAIEAGHRLWIEVGPGSTLTRMIEARGGTCVSLGDGPDALMVAAARLLSLGHPRLVDQIPGSYLLRALPAVLPAEPLPPRSAMTAPIARALQASSPSEELPAAHALVERAERVLDLRIGALTDAEIAPLYRAARSSLLRDLARADAAAVMSQVPRDLPPAALPRAAPPIEARIAEPVRSTPREPPAQAPPPAQASPPVQAPYEPAPPRAAAPLPPEELPREDLRAGVLAAICEVTGYPPDLVREGVDLEGDLGVDSIRKMEILGLLEKRYGFTTPESDYVALADADLAALVAHVERQQKRSAGQPAPEMPAREPSARLAIPIDVPFQASPAQADLGEILQLDASLSPEDAVLTLASLPLRGPLSAILGATPSGEAAAAWLRSAAKERGLSIRVLRVEESPERASCLPALASVPEGRELWLVGSALYERTTLAVAPAPAPTIVRPGLVVLATGGATGILVPCLMAIADLRPIVILMSRTESEAADKALAGLKAAGIDVMHVRGDVLSAQDVARAAQIARARAGRIDVVLHAAGILRDGPIGAVPEEEVRRVVRTKWDGANHLIEATRGDDLSLFCTFSSLVALAGNPSQTTYAAANAAMSTLRHPRAARSLCVAWTAWSGVGMASSPALLALLASRGLRPLSPEAGGEAMRALLLSEADGLVIAAAQPLPGQRAARWPLRDPSPRGARLSFPIPLDPSDPSLMDHRVGQRPLVPAALWFAAMIEAVRVRTGREGPWAVERFEVLVPTFVERVRSDVTLTLSPDGEGAWLLTIEAGGAEVCRARLAAEAESEAGPTEPLAPLEGAEPAGGLYRADLLFHGPSWQVLTRTRTDNGRSEADLQLDTAGSPMAGAIDGVHQLLAAWSERQKGWLGLPVGADRWVAQEIASGPLRIEVHTTESSDVGLSADVVARDPVGRVVLRGEGVRMRAARRGSADA